MEGSSRKRPFVEDVDDDANKAPQQKRVRFPKGKKMKTGDYVVDEQPSEETTVKLPDPQLAARERAKRRSEMAEKMFDDENRGIIHDISRAEVQYENNETFIDDGVPIEPFNLSKEREEGYFDAAGNYVEYVQDNQIKDAWLDSVEVVQGFAASTSVAPKNEDEASDLSSDDIGKIKRRIADTLQAEETVLQALRRLKGTSNNKKEKMSAERKQLFDQLTEDAMALMESGDFNVYDENKETFQREAEGYERLAAARRQDSNTYLEPKEPGSSNYGELGTVGINSGRASTIFDSNPSALNVSASSGGGSFDMFAEDDENANQNPVSDTNSSDPSRSNEHTQSGDLQNDYVFDESTGYYYSSSLGYYYDPSSGLYCNAASGQWYSYNEESGTYSEVQETTSTMN